MKTAVAIVVALAVLPCCLAQGSAALTPPGTDSEHSLPKYMTPEEKLLPPLPVTRDGREPPSGAVHCAAEYEPMEGLLIAWEGYTDVLTAMVVPITTHDDQTMVYCVVDNSSEQTSAYNSLAGAGADMDQVEFLVCTTDTVWIRDYGPRYIFEDGVRTIIDHTYNRPRPNDNLFNDFLSTYWDEPQYDIPLTHGGGNFHLFSNGDAFMSTLILSENPGLSEQDVIDLYADYQNVDLTIYPGFPTSYDSTRHIDMWMLPVDDYEIIIGEYPPSDTTVYNITEDAVADLEARGYTVWRTPGWNSGGTHYTYTNAVILNDLVFVPKFNYASQDAQALAVFQQAFEDKIAIQVNCAGIISAAGAMHCIVMHVPIGLALTLSLPDDLPEYIPPFEDTALVVQILDGAETFVSGSLHYRYDGQSFTESPLAPLGNHLFLATLPAPECDAVPEFYFSATGSGGTTVTYPADAPGTLLTTTVGVVETALADDFELDLGWTVASDPSLTGGEWERGVPLDDGVNGDPTEDYDGSGQCYLTQNMPGNSDVDGGPTMLLSPILDLSGMSNPILRYARWMSCDDAGSAAEDFLAVEISNDAGGSWEVIEVVPDTEGWVAVEVHVVDYVTPTAAVQVRFSVEDVPNNSITEAGLDAFTVFDVSCAYPWPLGDMNCDGEFDFGDINPFVLALASQEQYELAFPECDWMNADCNEDGAVDFKDINAFVALFAPGP